MATSARAIANMNFILMAVNVCQMLCERMMPVRPPAQLCTVSAERIFFLYERKNTSILGVSGLCSMKHFEFRAADTPRRDHQPIAYRCWYDQVHVALDAFDGVCGKHQT